MGIELELEGDVFIARFQGYTGKGKTAWKAVKQLEEQMGSLNVYYVTLRVDFNKSSVSIKGSS